MIVEVAALCDLIALPARATAAVTAALFTAAIRRAGRLRDALIVEITALYRTAKPAVTTTAVVATLLPLTVGLACRDRLTYEGVGAHELL